MIGPEWPTRALLRAQLLDAGYEVVATDAWPIPRQFLRAGMKPDLVIVDLHGLPEPARALEELCGIFGPDRVLVVTALGTLTSDEIGLLGVRVVARPASVGDIVAAATALLAVRGT